MINKLQEIISELSLTIANLLEVSKEKQKVLVNRDHENLNSLINQEQRLLTDLNALSNQQKVVTAKVKSEFQVPDQLTSVSEILELIDGKVDAKIKRNIEVMLNKIKNHSEELSVINAQNKMLIESSREFIKGIIHAVRGNDNKSIINRKM